MTEPTPHIEPQQPAEQPAYGAPASAAPSPLDDAQRQSMLAQAVARSVAGGGRVESHSPFQAIIVTGSKINHTLHLILTLVTCGFWGLVWAGLALFVKEKRTVLTIDAYGNVLSQ